MPCSSWRRWWHHWLDSKWNITSKHPTDSGSLHSPHRYRKRFVTYFELGWCSATCTQSIRILWKGLWSTLLFCIRVIYCSFSFLVELDSQCWTSTVGSMANRHSKSIDATNQHELAATPKSAHVQLLQHWCRCTSHIQFSQGTRKPILHDQQPHIQQSEYSNTVRHSFINVFIFKKCFLW